MTSLFNPFQIYAVIVWHQIFFWRVLTVHGWTTTNLDHHRPQTTTRRGARETRSIGFACGGAEADFEFQRGRPCRELGIDTWVEVVHVRSSVVVGGTVEVDGVVVVGRTMAANAPDGRDGIDSVRDMEHWKHRSDFPGSMLICPMLCCFDKSWRYLVRIVIPSDILSVFFVQFSYVACKENYIYLPKKIFILPKKIIKAINALLRNFLWSGYSEGRKAPVAWSKVYRPREEGGLGLKDILSWNKILIAELIYNLISDTDSIWNSWGRAKLPRNQSFWDISKKGTDIAIWTSLLNTRDSIQCRLNAGHDPIIMTRNDKFDNKSLFEELRSRGRSSEWNNYVWGKLVTPRVSFMNWMVIQGGIQTKHKLHRMGITQNNLCPLCNAEAETAEHLWFRCRYSKDVLNFVLRWGKIDRRQIDFQEWINYMAKLKNKNTLRFALWVCSITTTSYYIWRSRNLRVLQDKIVEPFDCTKIIISHVCNCTKARWRKDNRETRNWLDRVGIRRLPCNT